MSTTISQILNDLSVLDNDLKSVIDFIRQDRPDNAEVWLNATIPNSASILEDIENCSDPVAIDQELQDFYEEKIDVKLNSYLATIKSSSYQSSDYNDKVRQTVPISQEIRYNIEYIEDALDALERGDPYTSYFPYSTSTDPELVGTEYMLSYISDDEESDAEVGEIEENPVEALSKYSGEFITSMNTVSAFIAPDVFDTNLYCVCEHWASYLYVELVKSGNMGSIAKAANKFKYCSCLLQTKLAEFASSNTHLTSKGRGYLVDLPDTSDFLKAQKTNNFDHYKLYCDSLVNHIIEFCAGMNPGSGPNPSDCEENSNPSAKTLEFLDFSALEMPSCSGVESSFGFFISYDKESYTPSLIPDIAEFVVDENGNTYSLYEEIFGHVQVPVKLIGTGDNEEDDVFIYSITRDRLILGAKDDDWHPLEYDYNTMFPPNLGTSQVLPTLLSHFDSGASMKRKTYCVRAPCVYGDSSNPTHWTFSRSELGSTHEIYHQGIADVPHAAFKEWITSDNIDSLVPPPDFARTSVGTAAASSFFIQDRFRFIGPQFKEYANLIGWKTTPYRNIYYIFRVVDKPPFMTIAEYEAQYNQPYDPTNSSASYLVNGDPYEPNDILRIELKGSSASQNPEPTSLVGIPKAPDIIIQKHDIYLPQEIDEFVEDEQGNKYSLLEEITGNVNKTVKVIGEDVYIYDFDPTIGGRYPSGYDKLMVGCADLITGNDTNVWNAMTPHALGINPAWTIPNTAAASVHGKNSASNVTYAIRHRMPVRTVMTQLRFTTREDISVQFWCTHHVLTTATVADIPFDIREGKGKIPSGIRTNDRWVENYGSGGFDSYGGTIKTNLLKDAMAWRSSRNLYFLIAPSGPDANKIGTTIRKADLEGGLGYLDCGGGHLCCAPSAFQKVTDDPDDQEPFFYTWKFQIMNSRSYTDRNPTPVDDLPEAWMYPYV